jgi:hypothetical protein
LRILREKICADHADKSSNTWFRKMAAQKKDQLNRHDDQKACNDIHHDQACSKLARLKRHSRRGFNAGGIRGTRAREQTTARAELSVLHDSSAAHEGLTAYSSGNAFMARRF